jgi:hypothetical protein
VNDAGADSYYQVEVGYKSCTIGVIGRIGSFWIVMDFYAVRFLKSGNFVFAWRVLKGDKVSVLTENR